MNNHPFHLVDVSPWPLLSATSLLLSCGGGVSFMHGGHIVLMTIGFAVLLCSVSIWWRDVVREATYQGNHTAKVEHGLRLGMLLFISSECFFFLAFFWAFFHASLSPNIEVGSCWPPFGVDALNPFGLPLLNTVILLSSGSTVTWAHACLLDNRRVEVLWSLGVTVLLGIYFTLMQGLEYSEAGFTMADGIYGSIFYVATGFHGLHVIIGTIFICVGLWRCWMYHFSASHHFGFEASAWYWHFVDVVWLFLFLTVYWWGF